MGKEIMGNGGMCMYVGGGPFESQVWDVRRGKF